MRRRGFTLIEIMVVVLTLAVLLGLATGALARYRATVALNTAVDRLLAELQSAQQQSRTLALDPLHAVKAVQTHTPGTPLVGRILEKLPGEPQRISKEWSFAEGSQTLTLESNNLPRIEYEPADQGLQLQILEKSGNNLRVLVSVPFRSNGELVPLVASPPSGGSITIGNGYTKQRVSISPIGKITRENL